jgi:hypothetical protein
LIARFRRISPLAAMLILALVTGSSCATSGDAVPAYEIKNRLRGVSIGETIDAVHARIGDSSVRNPIRNGDPIPMPLRELRLTDADGRKILVEIYVIQAWRADGCSGFHYHDTPITYIDGMVASLEWNELEWSWPKWGGSLQVLREAQDRFSCP